MHVVQLALLKGQSISVELEKLQNQLPQFGLIHKNRMSEFFLELFSEEIPAGLQKNLRETLITRFFGNHLTGTLWDTLVEKQRAAWLSSGQMIQGAPRSCCDLPRPSPSLSDPLRFQFQFLSAPFLQPSRPPVPPTCQFLNYPALQRRGAGGATLQPSRPSVPPTCQCLHNPALQSSRN